MPLVSRVWLGRRLHLFNSLVDFFKIHLSVCDIIFALFAREDVAAKLISMKSDQKASAVVRRHGDGGFDTMVFLDKTLTKFRLRNSFVNEAKVTASMVLLKNNFVARFELMKSKERITAKFDLFD